MPISSIGLVEYSLMFGNIWETLKIKQREINYKELSRISLLMGKVGSRKLAFAQLENHLSVIFVIISIREGGSLLTSTHF